MIRLSHFANPWTAQNDGAPPPRHKLGFWLTYRKLATVAYAPNRWERAKVRDGFPYLSVVNWNLVAQDTQEYEFVLPGRFALEGLLADSFLANLSQNFQFELYSTQDKRPMTAMPVHSNLGCGTGSKPFFFRRIKIIEAGETVLTRITNLASSNNQGQMAIFGDLLEDPNASPQQQAAWGLARAAA